MVVKVVKPNLYNLRCFMVNMYVCTLAEVGIYGF